LSWPKNALRFAVLCDGPSLPEWQHQCLEQINRLNRVEPPLVIVCSGDTEGIAPCDGDPDDSRFSLWHHYHEKVVSRAAASLQRRPVCGAMTEAVLTNASVRSTHAGCSQIAEPDLSRFREQQFDFILDFTSRLFTGPIHEVARYGIWSFVFGNAARAFAGPAGFWESLREDPITTVTLVRQTARGNTGVQLYQGHFKTDMVSYARGLDEINFGIRDWAARVCKDILNGCAEYLDGTLTSTITTASRVPVNSHVVAFLAKQSKRWLSLQWQSLFRHQQWSVGVIDAPVGSLVEDRSGGVSEDARWLESPAGRFLADPFAVPASEGQDGDLLLMAEDYDWRAERGRLSAVRITSNGASDPHVLFDLPVHMSYPFLLREKGRLHCIPETNEASEVCLYSLDEGQLVWSREAVLIEGRRLVDSTVFQHEGRWWLFASDEENGPHCKLQAWHAPELIGPWVEHSANPLKTDVRSSRSGGRPFMLGDQLYRPAQDCSEVYGGAVAINRVVTLNPDQFREETVSFIKPNPRWHFNGGMHTLCGVGDQTVIDAFRMTFVPRAFAAALLRKLSAPARKLGFLGARKSPGSQ
jgi:hypothetical protein